MKFAKVSSAEFCWNDRTTDDHQELDDNAIPEWKVGFAKLVSTKLQY